MLVSLREVLEDARARHYGVGMFNAFSMELACGVIDAAEELQAPVILGTAEALLEYNDLDMVGNMVGFLARRAKVPVVMHLDHGFNPAIVRHAIEDLGFTSVMYDCSEDPYEDNVRKVHEMAELAHRHAVSIEAELGHVTFGSSGASGYVYTSPEEVIDFTTRTEVDALAIAIGTAHGVYSEKPILDLERLRAIRRVTDTALVLHGGSGLSDDDFRNVVRDGIQKINIYTDISLACSQAAHDWVENIDHHFEHVSKVLRQTVKAETIKKLSLFGCAGKA